MTYAEQTTVPVERSRAEIDTLLQKHGATQRGIMNDDDKGMARLFFTLSKRQIRLEVPLPKADEQRFTHESDNKWASKRPLEKQKKLYEQACRTRWRVMLLFLKSKLELIELGVSTPEREFLADVVLPGGATVYEALCKPLEESYLTGNPLPLLPSGPVEGVLE